MEIQLLCSFLLPLPLHLLEYIKMRVENFHLIMQIYAKVMLCKFLSYLLRKIILILFLKSANKLLIDS